MGFIGSMLNPNTAGGFQATTSGAAEAQQDTSYGNTQDAIQRQKQFVDALTNQGGLANQTAVFQQQQALANQLQGVASGTGPNPALAQLAQATQANTANQAALMAGQRGSSQNTGLIARQAAQQGAQNQQQSAGQAATLQAQQQLAAMQQLQGQQASMGNLANTQVGQQQQGLQSLSQASLGQQGNLLGAQANQNQVNAGIAAGNQKGQQNLVSGLMGGIGAALSLAEGGQVPTIQSNPLMQNTAQKQVAEPTVQPQTSDPVKTPQSNIGKYLNDPESRSAADIGAKYGSALRKGVQSLFSSSTQSDSDALAGYDQANQQLGGLGGVENVETEMPAAMEDIGMMAAKGGKVKALLSPGERYLSPNKLEAVKKGADPIKEGKKVPGKPKVGGAKDSYKNDTIKASLDEGGVVLPRSVTMSKDAEKKAVDFVRAILAKHGSGLK